MQQIADFLPGNFEPGNILLVLTFVCIALVLLSGLSSPRLKLERKNTLNLGDTSIDGFDSYSRQEQLEIITALNDGTARFGRRKLGKMRFDISTGHLIKSDK